MSNRMIIVSPTPEDFSVTLEQFRAAADYWQPHAHLGGSNSDSDPSDATISIDRPHEPGFQIVHFRNGAMISTDGTPEQAAEVAVWAANTFPKTGPGELWMTDQGYSGHTTLHPGISLSDVLNGWQNHE